MRALLRWFDDASSTVRAAEVDFTAEVCGGAWAVLDIGYWIWRSGVVLCEDSGND